MIITAATFSKHQKLYDEIVQSHPSLLRGKVWCSRCRQAREVDAAECLRNGWPKCCSVTMTIDPPKGANP
jgi:hypothetical protein